MIGPSYRLPHAEQGSSVVWDTRALAEDAGTFGLLLRADAVAYAVRGTAADGARESHGAQDGVARLVESGVAVRYVAEDAQERGLERHQLIEGVEPLKERDVPCLLSCYEQVWRSRVENGLLVL